MFLFRFVCMGCSYDSIATFVVAYLHGFVNHPTSVLDHRPVSNIVNSDGVEFTTRDFSLPARLQRLDERSLTGHSPKRADPKIQARGSKRQAQKINSTLA